MNKKNDGLSLKEKQFCSYYVSSGNYKEAAASAGFTRPEKNGALLLMREDINAEINRIFNAISANCRQKARAGYERLAFGNVSDAIRLMFEDNPLKEQLKEYDLFNVAEIKRPKDGAMEIKFFDRIKALEKLECADDGNKNTVSDFYSALVGGLKSNDDTSENID